MTGLVLSSHLLFSYADRLDLGFHREVIRELMRVASDELRIFPLVAVGSSLPYSLLNELLTQLGDRGVVGRVVAVDYEFQAGGNQMLICRPSGTRWADRLDHRVADDIRRENRSTAAMSTSPPPDMSPTLRRRHFSDDRNTGAVACRCWGHVDLFMRNVSTGDQGWVPAASGVNGRDTALMRDRGDHR